MKRKILGFLLAVMLAAVFSLVIAVSVEANGSPSTWYVNETLGTDDVTQGTGTGTNAFKTIQYAINDGRVADGDTINVAAGNYTENVTIVRSLNLLGEDAETTFISNGHVSINLGYADGGGPLAETVVFDGFTVTNDAYLINILDVINASSLTISDNILHGCDYGIRLTADTIDFSSSVIIDGNIIYGCEYGMDLSSVTGGSHLDIDDNLLFGNTTAGIHIDSIIGGSEIHIEDNDLYENVAGIQIMEVAGGSTINIIENDINDNDEKGIFIPSVTDGSVLNIEYNEVFENGGTGISIEAVTGNSALYYIYNDIYENTGAGLSIGVINGNSTVVIGGDSFEDDSNLISENAQGISVGSCNASTLTIQSNYIGGWYEDGDAFGGNTGTANSTGTAINRTAN